MTNEIPVLPRAWLSWIALTLVGIELAMLIVYSAINIAWSHPNMARTREIPLDVATVGLAATVFGAAQWIWFRARVYKAGWWIVATVATWYCTIGVFWFANSTVGDRFHDVSKASATVVMLVLTIFLGTLPQWLLVRRNFSRAGMWIIARGFGWVAGLGLLALAEWVRVFQIGFLLGPDLVLGNKVPEVAAIAVAVGTFGVGYAAVTGVAAVWMQNHPKQRAIGLD